VPDQGEAVGDRLELVRRCQPFAAEPLGDPGLEIFPSDGRAAVDATGVETEIRLIADAVTA
jgi:hypothetical protein